MQDKELYQDIPGRISPWTVSDVKFDIPAEEIQVRVEHLAGTKCCCPECQKELCGHDHGGERRWWHLDSCQYKTILIGRVPRVDCPEHGVNTVNETRGTSPSFFEHRDPLPIDD
ncbi:MAG: transposase family protein [Planctomycetota bacterium]